MLHNNLLTKNVPHTIFLPRRLKELSDIVVPIMCNTYVYSLLLCLSYKSIAHVIMYIT
jgi:Na+/alanine symporter